MLDHALAGRRIAVPESRELDLFVSMLERAGAVAIRCPLLSIHDAEDQGPVLAWLRRLVAGDHDDLVLYTGEGVRRLLGAADRAGMRAEVVEAFARPRKVVRGPKPSRALREIGLGPDVSAGEPTTDGLIATLSQMDLAGRRIGIQLYPDHPPSILAFLESAGGAVDPVLPYRYASNEEDDEVIGLVERMAAGEVDAIALTSRPQVKRLVDLGRERGLEDLLKRAVERTLVAAIGPITAEAARAAGWRVATMPETSFHLRPMIIEMASALSAPAESDPALAS